MTGFIKGKKGKERQGKARQKEEREGGREGGKQHEAHAHVRTCEDCGGVERVLNSGAEDVLCIPVTPSSLSLDLSCLNFAVWWLFSSQASLSSFYLIFNPS